MLKFLEVIPRRPDLSHEYFLKRLSTTHLEVVDKVPEFRNRVRRYVQNHLYVRPNEVASVHGRPANANADGLIEVWFDSIGDVIAAFQEPRYFEIIRPDELAFGDVPGAWGLPTHETQISERRGFEGLTKLFVFLERSEGVSHTSFRERWCRLRDERLTGSPTFQTRVGRLIENWVSQDPAEALPGMKPYDLVVQLSLQSLADVALLTADTALRTLIGGGEDAEFVNPSRTLIYLGKENPAATQWLIRRQSG